MFVRFKQNWTEKGNPLTQATRHTVRQLHHNIMNYSLRKKETFDLSTNVTFKDLSHPYYVQLLRIASIEELQIHREKKHDAFASINVHNAFIYLP